MEEFRVKCCVCGRKPVFYGEGRWIDGRWIDDWEIPREFWGKWVCGWACYSRLKKKTKKGGDTA